MKAVTRNIITLLAPLAFLAFGSIANATTYSTTYSDDDLFIGFHVTSGTGSSSDYLVDIGQASTFTASKTLTLGNIAQDLSDTFGSDWATNPNIKWGVIGTTYSSIVGTDPADTIYASRQGNASSTTPWTSGSSYSLGSSDVKIVSMEGLYANKTSTANSPVGLVQNNIGTQSNNAYASYQPGGANATGGASNMSFARFNPTIEASSSNGITDSSATLALFRLVPGANGTPGTAVGTFAIDSSGTVTFTAATLPSAFNTWASSYSLSGAAAQPTADPANDGVQNMVKFVLGADPTKAITPANMPSGTISGVDYVYSFPFNSASTTEYTTTAEYSTDLVTWTTAPVGTVGSGGIYTTIIPRSSATKFFTRLRVTSK